MLSPAVFAIPAVLLDQPLRHLAMRIQEAQRSRLVNIHQTGIAGHVGGEDSGEPPLHD